MPNKLITTLQTELIYTPVSQILLFPCILWDPETNSDRDIFSILGLTYWRIYIIGYSIQVRTTRIDLSHTFDPRGGMRGRKEEEGPPPSPTIMKLQVENSENSEYLHEQFFVDIHRYNL